MRKIYYLSTCDTCKRIMNELSIPDEFEKQDIKNENLSQSELEAIKQLAGTYEALFSKRARLYKERNLKNQSLTETDYKNLILEHYTFLKRPVLVIDEAIFIGNSKKVVEAAKSTLRNS